LEGELWRGSHELNENVIFCTLHLEMSQEKSKIIATSFMEVLVWSWNEKSIE